MRRLADADPQEEDAAECCQACGSFDLVSWQWEGSSGVSIDGYSEPWVQRGIRCLSCGAIEEE
jgi:hypothetical protein